MGLDDLATGDLRPRRRRSSTGPAGPGSSSPRLGQPERAALLEEGVLLLDAEPRLLVGVLLGHLGAAAARVLVGCGSIVSGSSTSHSTRMSSPPRIGSGHWKTGLQHAVRVARPAPGWWTNRRSPRCRAPLPSSRILVLDRIMRRRLGAVDPDVLSPYATECHPSCRPVPRTGGRRSGPVRTSHDSGGRPRTGDRRTTWLDGSFDPLPDCERRVNWAVTAASVAAGWYQPALPTWRRRPDRSRRRAGAKMESHGSPAGLRAAHGRGTTGPPRPALVHRRARPAQVGRHLAGRARGGLRGGRAVRRLGHRRLQPGPGERRARLPRPATLPAHAWRRRRGADRPHLLRHHQPRRHAVRGRPPPGAASAT